MKFIARFLLAVLCAVPFGADCANVPSTRGNNLTAYNGASGSTNNNNWNSLMNVRSGVDAADMPVADFGNCNAIVLRCAQPKCANGGCVDMDVTATIVAGCVRSNESCMQYGDDLVEYISAQLVAQSTAKSNANQAAAANAAAAQSAQQIAAMQQQMQQMQSQMAQQNAETVAQLQSALAEQQQLTAQAIADATARDAASMATNTGYVSGNGGDNSGVTQQSSVAGLTVAQQIAAQNGVSADVLAREQITGQIMSAIENAETQLKTLKTTMTDTFDYAGCDSKGNNCTGPKRVKVFKQKAMDFFEPYENVLDELYDALILAQSVGVDITDIYMMLNDSCNVWGKYMCVKGANGKSQDLRYTNQNCKKDNATGRYISQHDDFVIDGRECTIGKIIPVSDGGCQPLGLIPDGETVRYNWLNPEDGDETLIRVGCMSDMLETSVLFRNRKKGASIDIETLQRIIEQDAPSVYGSRWENGTSTTPMNGGVQFCKVNEESYVDLEKIVSLKTLPKDVCVTQDKMKQLADEYPSPTSEEKEQSVKEKSTFKTAVSDAVKTQAQKNCESVGTWTGLNCICPTGQTWNGSNCVMNGTGKNLSTLGVSNINLGDVPSGNTGNVALDSKLRMQATANDFENSMRAITNSMYGK